MPKPYLWQWVQIIERPEELFIFSEKRPKKKSNRHAYLPSWSEEMPGQAFKKFPLVRPYVKHLGPAVAGE